MSGANFSLSFDPQQLQAVIASVAATPAEVNKAADRAARHTMNVMKTLIARTVAAETGIPVTKLKTRISVRKSMSGSTPEWILFVGLNAMPFDRAGSISQDSVGLRHMGRVVKGGFDQNIFGVGRGWIRKKRARALNLMLPGLNDYSPESHRTMKLNSSRFPVLRISHDLSTAANAVIMAFESKATARFYARFEHDLKYIKEQK